MRGLTLGGGTASRSKRFTRARCDRRPAGFIIQNSWGPRRGYRGFAVLTYPDWLQNGMDAWAAVLGAPVAVKGSPVALSTSPLQDLPKKGANIRVALSGGRITFVSARNPAVAPWTEDQAHQHSLVLGNAGAVCTAC